MIKSINKRNRSLKATITIYLTFQKVKFQQKGTQIVRIWGLLKRKVTAIKDQKKRRKRKKTSQMTKLKSNLNKRVHSQKIGHIEMLLVQRKETLTFSLQEVLVSKKNSS